MKRIVVRRPGGHGALEYSQSPDPSVGPGQARVRVRAIGINYADCIVRMGYYEAAKGLYPLSPGFEFAGIVDAVGSGNVPFSAGDRVFGITRFGAYASSIAVDAGQIWRCPEGWDFPDCAAFPAVFLTAYHALFRVAKVEAGEILLVHSAAGGVGNALLQLGRIAGCRSIGIVGSQHKVALCRELGAEQVLLRSPEFWGKIDRLVPQGFDAVFDANGVGTLRAGFDRLAPGGRLVVYGFADMLPRGKDKPSLPALAWNYLRVPKFSPLEMTTTNRAVLGFNVVFLFHKISLAQTAIRDMLGWIAEGKIKKTCLTSFPFEEAARAHKTLEAGSTTGKLVLIVPA